MVNLRFDAGGEGNALAWGALEEGLGGHCRVQT